MTPDEAARERAAWEAVKGAEWALCQTKLKAAEADKVHAELRTVNESNRFVELIQSILGRPPE